MKLYIPFNVAGISGLWLLMHSTVWADVLPGSVLPETVTKALVQQQPQPTQVTPSFVAPPQKEETPGGEAAKKIKFKLNGIILVGNHVFTTEQLLPIYKDKLHKVITVADLFTIVQNITNYYRNSGYIISRAILPPQHVKGGVVKIQIIEGFLDKVYVTGTPHGAKCLIQAYGQKISQCHPLEISRMEYYLLVANETPGTQVKAVLAPSKNKTGAADLSLLTQNKMFSGYVSYDKYGTRYIGPQQMTANIAGTSLIASGDAAQFTVTKTPKGGELTFMDLNYNLPIMAEGARVLIGGTRTQTHPLFVLRPAQIDGLTKNYYANFSFPLIRTRAKTLTLQVAFNYLDTYVTTFGQQLYTDHLRPLGVGLSFNFADQYAGSNSFYGDFRQGLPILGYTSNTDPQTARTSHPGGRGDFSKIDLSASRLQGLKGSFSLYGLLRGQWAFAELLASEQYTFGGSQLGRGYDVAELIGDKGLAGTLELRYDLGIGKELLQSLQFYAFYDAGKIWNFKNPGGSPLILSGTSAGAGVRFYCMKYVSGNLMWTQTLTKQVAAEELIGDGRRPRVFFSAIASF